jgi:hypothetical protein
MRRYAPAYIHTAAHPPTGMTLAIGFPTRAMNRSAEISVVVYLLRFVPTVYDWNQHGHSWGGRPPDHTTALHELWSMETPHNSMARNLVGLASEFGARDGSFCNAAAGDLNDAMELDLRSQEQENRSRWGRVVKGTCPTAIVRKTTSSSSPYMFAGLQDWKMAGSDGQLRSLWTQGYLAREWMKLKRKLPWLVRSSPSPHP